MAGRPKGSAGAKHIVPMVRGGFITAIERLKKKGAISDFADLWEEIIAADPAKALELLAKYVPREMLIEIDDARPFAFLDRALTAIEWQQAHGGPKVIEHDGGDGTH